jgi:serine/threonine protein kinase
MESSFAYPRSLPSTLSSRTTGTETRSAATEPADSLLTLLSLATHLVELGSARHSDPDSKEFFIHIGPEYNYGTLRTIGRGATFAVKRYVFNPPQSGPNGLQQYGALKRVRPSSPTSRSAKLAAVVLELRSLLLPRLRLHENIVKCLGLGWEDDVDEVDQSWPVILLEYADLGSLATFQERRLILRYETKKNLCLDVGLGLLALHDYGICHGDVKSENILLFSHAKRGMIAKLGDFGFSFSTFTYKDTDRPWIKQKLGGTFPYNAPECRGQVPAEQLKFTDIYSYGLLVWRTMIDGQNPFDTVGDMYQIVPEPGSLDYLNYSLEISKAEKIIHMKENTDLSFWAQAAFMARAKEAASDIDAYLHEILGVLQVTLNREPRERSLVASLLYLKISPSEWKQQGR